MFSQAQERSCRDWSSLPSGVLLHVLAQVLPSLEVPDPPSLYDVCAARLVCRTWRANFDSARKRLHLRAWPHLARRGVFSTHFDSITQLDLGSLRLDRLLKARSHAAAAAAAASAGAPTFFGRRMRRGLRAALQAPGGEPVALDAPMATSRAVQQMWSDLPQLPRLRSLVLSASTLAIGASTSCLSNLSTDTEFVDGLGFAVEAPQLRSLVITYDLQLPAELGELQHLKQLHIDWHWPAMQTVLQSQDAESVLGGLGRSSGTSSSSGGGGGVYFDTQYFDAWCVSSSGDSKWGPRVSSSSSSPDPASAAAAGSSEDTPGGSGTGGLLQVSHCTSGNVILPPHFGRLQLLSDLTLSGHVWEPGALLVLRQLPGVTCLSLGPGYINLEALLALGDAWLGRLTQLGISQAGVWQLPALRRLLAAVHRLEGLVVEEVQGNWGVTGEPAAAAMGHDHHQGQPQQQQQQQDVLWAADEQQQQQQQLEAVAGMPVAPRAQGLTPADMAPLGGSLTRLVWRTSAHRCLRGTSLLQQQDAAAWVAPLAALKSLTLEGLPSASPGGAVLVTLDTALLRCSALEELQVLNLGVPQLPGAISQLTNLRSVAIEPGAAGVRALSEPAVGLAPLGSCQQLQVLRLTGCELRELPHWLALLSELRVLSLQGNQLKQLDEERPGMGLPVSLQHLNLADNRICALPKSVGDLQQLQVMVLDNNYIGSLPRRVWRLPHLQVLSVARNMLSSLPEVPYVPPVAPAPTAAAAVAAAKGGSSSSSSCAAVGISAAEGAAAAAAAGGHAAHASNSGGRGGGGWEGHVGTSTGGGSSSGSSSSSSHSGSSHLDDAPHTAGPSAPPAALAAADMGRQLLDASGDSDDDVRMTQDQQALSWALSAGLGVRTVVVGAPAPWSSSWRHQHVTAGAAVRYARKQATAAAAAAATATAAQAAAGAGARGSQGLAGSTDAGGAAAGPYQEGITTRCGGTSSSGGSAGGQGGSEVAISIAGPSTKPSCCDSLRVLIADHNQLSSLPASLGQLRALQVLQLRNNHLRSLPSSCVSGLSQLVYCCLQHNHLQKLPSCLSRLPRLAVLNVGSNHVVEPPRWLRALHSAVDLEDQSQVLGGHRCALKMLLLGLRELAVAMKDAKSAAALQQARGLRAVKAQWKRAAAAAGAAGPQGKQHHGLLLPALGHSVEVAGFKLPLL